jgi:hypothetical protein
MIDERNEFKDLVRFMTAWDVPAADNIRPSPPTKGAGGNINIDGSIEGLAAIVTRHHPDFTLFLEDGVRDLVLCLIDALDCITYSSCSGHASTDGRLICMRHVGIVPRNRNEYRRIRECLGGTLKRSELRAQHAKLELYESTLDSDDICLPCIDLVFIPLIDDAEHYFPAADRMTSTLMQLLINGAPR